MRRHGTALTPRQRFDRLSTTKQFLLLAGGCVALVLAVLVGIGFANRSSGPDQADRRASAYDACYVTVYGDYSPLDYEEDTDAHVAANGHDDYTVDLGGGFTCDAFFRGDKIVVTNTTPGS